MYTHRLLLLIFSCVGRWRMASPGWFTEWPGSRISSFRQRCRYGFLRVENFHVKRKKVSFKGAICARKQFWQRLCSWLVCRLWIHKLIGPYRHPILAQGCVLCSRSILTRLQLLMVLVTAPAQYEERGGWLRLGGIFNICWGLKNRHV